MKRIIKASIALLLAAQLFSCAPNGLNVKATEIAKKFYTEYLKNDIAYNAAKAEKIKKKYMTDVMVEEIDLRTKEMEADAVTGVLYLTYLKKREWNIEFMKLICILEISEIEDGLIH